MTLQTFVDVSRHLHRLHSLPSIKTTTTRLFFLPWCCLFSISFEYLEWRLCCILDSRRYLHHVRDLVPSSCHQSSSAGCANGWLVGGHLLLTMMLNDDVRFAAFSIHPPTHHALSSLHSHLPTPQVLLLLPSHCSGCSNPLLDSLVKSNPALIYLLLGRKSLLSACIFWQNLLSTRLYNCNLLPASRSCAECGVEW